MDEPVSIPAPARYSVTAPGPVCGGVMSVGFANGRAVVEDAVRHAQALAWFRAEPGYTVVELTPADSEPAPEPEPQPGPESSEEATDVDATPDTEGDTPEAPAAPAARRGK